MPTAFLARSLLAAALLPLAGCIAFDTSACDTASGAGCDDGKVGGNADTGVMLPFFTGALATDGDAFAGGALGYAFYGVGAEDFLCTVAGSVESEGAAPGGCPDCTWSFDTTAVSGSVADGTYCEQFGVSDGYLDGYLDYAWGFTDAYTYVYGDYTFLLEDVVMIYFSGSGGGWFPFAYSYNGYSTTSGDASYVSFWRPFTDDSGNPLYYYYYP